MNTQILITIVILLVAVLLYSTSFVSMTGTSFLILFALYVTGIVKLEDLFASFTSSATLLVVFMFMISGALLKSGASRILGGLIIRGAGSEKRVIIRLMIISMIISAFFSNMASAAIMATFAVGISKLDRKYRLPKMVLSIGLGCILGGMLTIIGVSGNVMFRSMLENAGVGTVGFWDFGKIGLPLCIAGVLYMFFLGYKLSPGEATGVVNTELAKEEEIFDRKRCILSLIIFVVVVAGMMSEALTHIPIHICAFTGVVVLLLSGTITEKEALSYVCWPPTIMFAALLTLGGAISHSGAADMIVDGMLKILEGSGNKTILLVLFVTVIVLTQFMSNGATSAVFYPIGLSLAARIGVSPVAVLMMINVAAGASYATPMATPLNAYLMSVGGTSFKDYVKIGVPMMIITTIICVILCPMIWAV